MAYLIPLSEKFLDFITAPPHFADFLEGTTKSGKTTVAAGVKFMLEVSRSDMQYHILASRTKGTAEKNIINQVNGICDLHRGKAVYYSNGNKNASLPHIEFEGKIIFVLGYDNQATWKNLLGGQYGCALCDEMQTSDPDFIRELFLRIKYFIGTLNPDDPRLPVYSDYINRSRPYKKWEYCVPPSIMKELEKSNPIKGYVYWFFTFEDNASLTKEMIRELIDRNPPGTKQYKNKIKGERGKATGLVFDMWKDDRNVVSKAWVKQQIEMGGIIPLYLTCGVDTSYSHATNDDTVFMFMMITADKKCIVLDEAVYNNKDRQISFTASDIVPACVRFLDRNCREWGRCPDVFIDNADPGTIAEFEKYRLSHGDCQYNFTECYKTRIFERIKMQQSWVYTGHYLVCDHCTNHLAEIAAYSWDDKAIDTPCDYGDHSINAAQYGWIPFRWDIGSIDFDRNEQEDY